MRETETKNFFSFGPLAYIEQIVLAVYRFAIAQFLCIIAYPGRA